MPKFSHLLGGLTRVGLLGLISLGIGCAKPQIKHEDSLPIESGFKVDNILIGEEPALVDRINNSVKKSARPRQRPLFDWPVWEARMTRGFLPKVKRKRKRPHKGIDLAAPRGSAVMASHDGYVMYTGSAFKGYGKMVMIKATAREIDGFVTLYGHLDKIVVYEGKKVHQGEVIGALGNTGRSSGPHLHFEIRKLNGPIDPLPLLPAGEALTNDVDNGAAED